MTNHKTTHPMKQMQSHFLEFNSNIGDMLDKNFIQRFSTNNTITDKCKKDDPDFILRYVDTTRVVATKSNENRFFEHYEGTCNVYNSFSFVCNNPELGDECFHVVMEIDGNNYLTSQNYSLQDMKNIITFFIAINRQITTPSLLFKMMYETFFKYDIEDRFS